MRKLHKGQTDCEKCACFGYYWTMDCHYYCETDRVVIVEINQEKETTRKCPDFKPREEPK